MWIKERWPGVFENALYDALVRLGVAMGLGVVVTAVFKWVGELPSWALFNIFVVTFVAVLFFMIFVQLRRIGPRLNPKMSPGMLERTLRIWLDDFHYRVRKNPDQEEKCFSLTVWWASRNISVEIMRRRREREQFLTLVGVVEISERVKKKWNSLQEWDRQRVSHEVLLELSRQKITCDIDYQQSVTVHTMVLIDELTQAILIDRIDDVDYAINLIVSKLRLLLDYDESLDKKEN